MPIAFSATLFLPLSNSFLLSIFRPSFLLIRIGPFIMSSEPAIPSTEATAATTAPALRTVTVLAPRGNKLVLAAADQADLVSQLSVHPLTCTYTSYALEGKENELRMTFVPYSLLTLKLHLQRMTDILSYRYGLALTSMHQVESRSAHDTLDIVQRQLQGSLVRPTLLSLVSRVDKKPQLLKGELHVLSLVLADKQAIEVLCTRQGFKTESRKRTFETLHELLLSVSEHYARTSRLLFQDLQKLSSVHTVPNPFVEETESNLVTGLVLPVHEFEIRDWNTAFQEAREIEAEELVRDREAFQVYCEFISAARRGVRDIVEGNLLPLNPEEPASSHAYLHNYIFYTRAVPKEDIPSTQQSQRPEEDIDMYKHAQIEMHAARLFLESFADTLQSEDDRVSMGPQCVIDYCGHRIHAQGLIPGVLNDRKAECLLYGTIEGVSKDDQRFHRPVNAWCSSIGLQPLSNASSKSVKGVAGTDRRVYALEMWSVLPVDPSATTEEDSSVMRLRPELVQSKKSIDEAINSFLEDVRHMEVYALTGQELVYLMHTHGINARHLGRVAQAASLVKDDVRVQYLQVLCRREAMVRVIKHAIRKALRSSSSTMDLSPVATLLESVIHLEPSALSTIVSNVNVKFPQIAVDQAHLTSVLGDVGLGLVVVKSAIAAAGLVLRSSWFDEIAALSPRPKHVFSVDDFEAIVPQVKTAYPHPRTGLSLLDSGRASLTKGQLEDGIVLVLKARAVLNAVHGPLSRPSADCLKVLAALHWALSDADAALQYQSQLYTVAVRLLGPEHPLAYHALESLGAMAHASSLEYGDAATASDDKEKSQQSINRKKELVGFAIVALERCLAIALRSGRSVLAQASVLGTLAAAYADAGEHDRALSAAVQVRAIQERIFGEDAEASVGSLQLIAQCLEKGGKYKEAIATLKKGVKAFKDQEDQKVKELNADIARLTETAVKVAKGKQ